MGEVVDLRYPVTCQKWVESSSDGIWLDGYSLHASLACLRRFVQCHWESLPDEVPKVYECPEGQPYTAGVGRKLSEQVKASGDGIRVHSLNYPVKMVEAQTPLD